jgi:16S rRNA processing protein RimM
MKPVLHPLGKITRTHGYHGIVVLVSEQMLDDDIEHLEEVFVMLDGLQVPFPVKELTLLTDTSAHLQLEFVGTLEEALGLVGCELSANVIPHKREVEAGLEQWIGFAVHDAKHGDAGIIQEIEDYNGNIVLQVMDGDRETLISLYPELVTNVDYQAKILYIAAPDGYFDTPLQ